MVRPVHLLAAVLLVATGVPALAKDPTPREFELIASGGGPGPGSSSVAVEVPPGVRMYFGAGGEQAYGGHQLGNVQLDETGAIVQRLVQSEACCFRGVGIRVGDLAVEPQPFTAGAPASGGMAVLSVGASASAQRFVFAGWAAGAWAAHHWRVTADGPVRIVAVTDGGPETVFFADEATLPSLAHAAVAPEGTGPVVFAGGTLAIRAEHALFTQFGSNTEYDCDVFAICFGLGPYGAVTFQAGKGPQESFLLPEVVDRAGPAGEYAVTFPVAFEAPYEWQKEIFAGGADIALAQFSV